MKTELKLLIVILIVYSVLFWITKCYAGEREDIAEYIHECNSKVDANYVADAIVTVFHDEYNQDPWLWTFVIDRESNFDTTATSPSGKHFHWTQLAKSHSRHFKAAGLTWMDDFSMLRFSAMMVQTALDKGKSLYTAYQPWQVRRNAFGDYKRKFGHKP